MRKTETRFRVISIIAFILISMFIACPLAYQSLKWLRSDKWPIGLLVLLLLLIGGLAWDIIGGKIIRRIRDKESDN